MTTCEDANWLKDNQVFKVAKDAQDSLFQALPPNKFEDLWFNDHQLISSDDGIQLEDISSLISKNTQHVLNKGKKKGSVKAHLIVLEWLFIFVKTQGNFLKESYLNHTLTKYF